MRHGVKDRMCGNKEFVAAYEIAARIPRDYGIGANPLRQNKFRGIQSLRRIQIRISVIYQIAVADFGTVALYSLHYRRNPRFVVGKPLAVVDRDGPVGSSRAYAGKYGNTYPVKSGYLRNACNSAFFCKRQHNFQSFRRSSGSEHSINY